MFFDVGATPAQFISTTTLHRGYQSIAPFTLADIVIEVAGVLRIAPTPSRFTHYLQCRYDLSDLSTTGPHK